jgi:tetratricopeptide (TPR) repeat protein
MQPSDEEDPDIDRRLQDMKDAIADLRQRCHTTKACKLAEDLVRIARREQRLIPLLHGQFEVVNITREQRQHQRGREVAVEMIALLESPDRARQIEAGFSEIEYAEAQGWMTACAYDNLAVHTAELHGFNSEGMHQCIGDGIEVCRRTGKLACITCFREYASDVYRAADDMDMSLHFARLGLSGWQEGSTFDRRWASASSASALLHLRGEQTEAVEMWRRSFELAATYHTPLAARIKSAIGLEQVLWESGRIDEFEQLGGAARAARGARALAPGENRSFDYWWDLRDAVAACCAGQLDKALESLRQWDDVLLRDRCLHEWFETRLRLIAAYCLAGKRDETEALARPLSKAAKKSRDWLTLRRLHRLLDPHEPLTPTAMVETPRVGPFARVSIALPVSTPEIPAALGTAAQTDSSDEAGISPLAAAFQQVVERFQGGEGSDPTKVQLLAELLDMPVELFVDPLDVARFLNIAGYLLTDVATFDAVWRWASSIASRYPQHASVLNLLATLGDILSSWPDATLDPPIESDRIEALFRQSLDNDSDSAPNYARAGAFFLGRDNLGEAERCLARSFRLERNNSFAAARLADIYHRTERPRDALAVLDLCLREGCEDADIAWSAAMTAYQLEQFESMLTYLERYETLLPDQPWVGHYRAIGYLESKKPEQALAAIELEERRSPERPFGSQVLRACAASSLGQVDRFGQLLDHLLDGRWGEVDYFTFAGLASLSLRLWNAAQCLPAGDQRRDRLANHLVVTGLAPDVLFEARRLAGQTTADVKYYRCAIVQPLDAEWSQAPGCLDGQLAWPEYRCFWGVLARDEEEAARLVAAQQAQCYGLQATVEAPEDLGQSFIDKPGILWQGPREHISEAADS